MAATRSGRGAAEEREACAQLIEKEAENWTAAGFFSEALCRLIRARGAKKETPPEDWKIELRDVLRRKAQLSPRRVPRQSDEATNLPTPPVHPWTV